MLCAVGTSIYKTRGPSSLVHLYVYGGGAHSMASKTRDWRGLRLRHAWGGVGCYIYTSACMVCTDHAGASIYPVGVDPP